MGGAVPAARPQGFSAGGAKARSSHGENGLAPAYTVCEVASLQKTVEAARGAFVTVARSAGVPASAEQMRGVSAALSKSVLRIY
jgi:hypothetical protein